MLARPVLPSPYSPLTLKISSDRSELHKWPLAFRGSNCSICCVWATALYCQASQLRDFAIVSLGSLPPLANNWHTTSHLQNQ